MTTTTLVEAMKDLAYDHNLVRLEAAERTAADRWTVTEIRHPTTIDPPSEWPDGWTVEQREVAL